MGVVGDSYSYPKSLFFQNYNPSKEFTPLDSNVLALLYDESIPFNYPTSSFESDFGDLLLHVGVEGRIGKLLKSSSRDRLVADEIEACFTRGELLKHSKEVGVFLSGSVERADSATLGMAVASLNKISPDMKIRLAGRGDLGADYGISFNLIQTADQADATKISIENKMGADCMFPKLIRSNVLLSFNSSNKARNLRQRSIIEALFFSLVQLPPTRLGGQKLFKVTDESIIFNDYYADLIKLVYSNEFMDGLKLSEFRKLSSRIRPCQFTSLITKYHYIFSYNIPIDIPPEEEPLHQALNCILTICQTRYLVNSSTSRRGYLNVRLTPEEYADLREHLQNQQRNEKVNLLDLERHPNSPVWTIIRQGLDFFKIAHKFVFRIVSIEINVQHAISVVKEFEHEIKKIPVCLAGDAAMAVHFWPGRGMNSGMKAAMALARNIARLFVRHDSTEMIVVRKPLTYEDFLEYEEFMICLRNREQHNRSLRITNYPIDRSVETAYDFFHLPGSYQFYINTLKSKLERARTLLQNRPDWPRQHSPITDKELDNASNRVSANAVAQLSLANPWPTREMAGDEILVENYFPLDGKTFLPLPSSVTWLIPDSVQQTVADNTTNEKVSYTSVICIVRSTDVIHPVWCIETGGDSFPLTAGCGREQYLPHEGPQNVFDLSLDTKYLCFGKFTARHDCNEKEWFRAGFNVTPSRGITCALGFSFSTSNDFPERDPVMITIEGSNEGDPRQGSSWTLIYDGLSGIEEDPGRKSCGVEKYISNDKWFTSYRVLVTHTRAACNCCQYSQFFFFGH
ncbi:unnamed protein product [Adineta ricciae]|uniref:Uncharacterized protein n=1 Tax=Adineta ricciae TaxID=249248 RepID=A0A814SVX8_ADIRI|nr:unnamed protein product [Adineta ricciae]